MESGHLIKNRILLGILKRKIKLKLKKFAIFTSLFLLIIIVVFFFRTQFYKVSSKKELIKEYRLELDGIAQKSLKNKDLPISAILIYNFNIIGRGHNTVVRDSDAGGHAIINAITDAIKNVGLETFNHLSRDSMKIITTYEPCEMCRGAMIEYGITNIEFLKSKSASYWFNKQYKELSYELTKRKLDAEELQDSLFRIGAVSADEISNY
jgi:tRNA(Arg) A34 adenosine deaminase TadA